MKESKKRALISVSDKTGAIDFAKGLSALGYEIISTGGTAAALSAAGVKNTGISDITGFPECLDGRVKTLHPAVHAGLLALRDDKSHMEQLEKLNLGTIDVVAVNLYPFKSTIEKPGVSLKEAVENIDIGGPTMLRSAAKNYRFVISAVDPADYPEILSRLKSGTDDEEFRLKLMYKVFQHTAVYDTLISGYLRGQADIELPDQITFAYEKAQELRYGENPHQSAAFYRECFKYPGALTAARQLHGKELSYNNINDANGALDLLREFNEPCAVAVKHANPCGCAVAEDITAAYIKAYESDPVSIFGGIVALNREVNEALAKELYKTFLEIIIAPAFTMEALMILTKKQNIRLLALPTINAPLKFGTLDMKKVVGGLLVQDCDNKVFEGELKCVTARAPTPEELKEMEFAWRVVKHCKSNAIALSKNGATVGIGVGQTNRVWATQQAIEHAGGNAEGSCMASDAFFPFNDCAEAAAKAGVTCIIQPGGSVRDADSIEMCNRHGIAMVFCGMRHFKH